MKKTRIISFVIAALFILSSLTCFAAYDTATYPNYSTGVGQVIAKNNTPTLDANISESEGWSTAAVINSTNMAPYWSAQSMCIISGNLYFAWDTTGLYVAADITDPSMVLSTAEDDINPNEDGTNIYGWNGDVFIFGIDPLAACFNAGMVSTKETTAWYCVGIGDGNAFKCYHTNTQSSDGDITASVSGAATTTTNGWAFECMIPWDMIIDDTANVSLGDVQLSLADITTAGAISPAGVIYMDRAVASDEFAQFNQGETAVANGEVFTISRNITIPEKLPDGTDGVTNGGESLRSYGIYLTIGDATGFAPETTTVETTTAETTAKTTTAKVDKKDEPDDVAVDNDNNKGGGVNVGLIIGIVVAVIVIAGIVVFFIIKKRRTEYEYIYVDENGNPIEDENAAKTDDESKESSEDISEEKSEEKTEEDKKDDENKDQ